jgi:hypothetical protein
VKSSIEHSSRRRRGESRYIGNSQPMLVVAHVHRRKVDKRENMWRNGQEHNSA